MDRLNIARRVAGIALVAAALGCAAPPSAIAADAKAAPRKTSKEAATAQAARGDKATAKDAAEAAEAARARALRDGWPDTPAGMVGSAWVAAFDGGEETMRAFLAGQLTEARLEERPMKARLESYRALRERYGDLIFQSVVETEPEELTVVLLAEDASPQRFVFTVEKESPHRLVQVGIIQGGHGHGGHARK